MIAIQMNDFRVLLTVHIKFRACSHPSFPLPFHNITRRHLDTTPILQNFEPLYTAPTCQHTKATNCFLVFIRPLRLIAFLKNKGL
uniref:Uncharacterized protein n=1 Tax=Anguilla anguilla TaxID=7936 RepID=A0A0E9X6X9_ANGAN